jgi:5-methylthioadenosine/S-adenosylhomocysteine deaminase
MKRTAILVSIGAAATLAAQTRQPASLVLIARSVVTQNASRQVVSPGAVAINGHTILEVGSPDAIGAKYRAAQTIRAPDQIVLPGLINTHTHAPMVMFRGLADDMALMEWLTKYIFPVEAKTVTPEMVRIGTRLAALEMIESGTTAYADMYYFEEEIAKATKQAGIRGILGQTIIQFPAPDAQTAGAALMRAERFLQLFQHDSLIVPAVAPHAPFTNDQAVLLESAALARTYGAPLLIHVAETEDEVRQIREKYSATPVGFLESIGFWTPRTLVAHGVWVNDDDIAMLKRRGVGVSHNPESNMKLSSGAAPVARYVKEGVALGLGTDGAASNNDLDMFEAMRQASFLAKHASRDPTVVPAQTALDLATIGGARALGMADLIGSIEAGKRADLITVSMSAARQTPLYNDVSHIVYTTRGDDVRNVIVDGAVVMRDRQVKTLDRAAVIADANRLAAAVRAAIRP